MKIIIERQNCVSCGTCWETCPGFFEQNLDDTLSQVLEKFRLEGNPAEGVPPGEQEACAAEAADLCPSSAILAEP